MKIKKERFYLIIIIALVLLNVSVLAYVLIQNNKQAMEKQPFPPPPMHEKGPMQVLHFLESELDLDEDQLDKFESLRHDHFENTKPIVEEIRTLKNEFFNLIFQENKPIEKITKLSDQIAKLQFELEMLTWNHLYELKSLCNEKQQEIFEELFNEAQKIKQK
jgi:hypothetical protein